MIEDLKDFIRCAVIVVGAVILAIVVGQLILMAYYRFPYQLSRAKINIGGDINGQRFKRNYIIRGGDSWVFGGSIGNSAIYTCNSFQIAILLSSYLLTTNPPLMHKVIHNFKQI